MHEGGGAQNFVQVGSTQPQPERQKGLRAFNFKLMQACRRECHLHFHCPEVGTLCISRGRTAQGSGGSRFWCRSEAGGRGAVRWGCRDSPQSPMFSASRSRVCATASELRYLQGSARLGQGQRQEPCAGACGGREERGSKGLGEPRAGGSLPGSCYLGETPLKKDLLGAFPFPPSSVRV